MPELMAASPLLAGGLVFLLGLCIGSFLNVVIYRLPVMLDREWRRQACEVLELPTPETPRFNLMTPPSRCPKCGHAITAVENIPVISWLALRGRCRGCGTSISARYPLVELATALLSLLVFAVFGPTGKMLAALALTWCLVALTMIDFDTQLLPDVMTLPLLWAGLLVNYHGLIVNLDQAVLGAAFGYLSLWSVYWAFKLATGKEGMGYGDFKLLAALGAWLGPMQLPLIILMSSLVGSIIGGAYLAIRKQNLPFAFGPYLAIAGFIALLGGPEIITWYLGTWKH
ncbi:type 4 prepilin peptidase 1 [Fluviicoccus keumensis]|uniref:Prepilin leader peptidase/N-methyltransferase n=1 Tax=Fluviicoccus keumensis TaxID=1435465 RepID=A0A4Q7ZA59_9GAMM|nr:A24 family peptidase [Fluviicoccus keumensis]RZU47440.1 type 4 prepilin peptidase 1 [Fluviicoccus keumensis]